LRAGKGRKDFDKFSDLIKEYEEENSGMNKFSYKKK